MRLPNPICALRYKTTRFEEAYHSRVSDLKKDMKVSSVVFPSSIMGSKLLKISEAPYLNQCM